MTCVVERQEREACERHRVEGLGAMLQGTEPIRQLAAHRAMRLAFYNDLGRSPPTDISHMSSYVRAVQRRWALRYRNSARQLLASIEGYRSWDEMMASNH